jgi:uncharacterized protein YjbI with pentapeptide repeats
LGEYFKSVLKGSDTLKNCDIAKRKIDAQAEKLKSDYNRAYAYHIEIFKDDYPIQTKRGKEKYSYTNTTFKFETVDYIFYNFNTWNFGAPVALSTKDYVIVEGLHINYCIFENCNFENIIFRNCSFSGSKFINTKLQRVVFEKCLFSVPVIEKGYHEVDNTYYAPTIFEGCVFVCDFVNCDVEYSLFERANFTLSNFKKSSLQYSVMNTCAMSSVQMQDCNLRDFSIRNTDIIDILFPDEQLTTVNENTLLDYSIKAKRKNANQKNDSGWIASSYDDMCLKKAQTIRNISRLFGECGYSDCEGELFYRAKRAELKGLHGDDKFKSVIALIICGYGERPSFTLLSIIIFTLLSGLLYMFSGIDAGGEVIKYSLGGTTPILQVLYDYGKCVFFSITTFSTVGYGNYVPIGCISMILSGVHMLIGVSLCALLTGCIFRKIAR